MRGLRDRETEGCFRVYEEAPGFRPGPRAWVDVAGNICQAQP